MSPSVRLRRGMTEESTEQQFPHNNVEWTILLVLTVLVAVFTVFLTLAWTQYRKNRSLLGYSLRHVFLGSSICQLAIILGAGDGFSLEKDSQLCRAQSVLTVFGNLYLSQWILGIMIMTYRQASKNRFVPRVAMQRNYNQIRVMAVCVATVLAVPTAFFTPVPVGTTCLPGDPPSIRIGLFGVPLLLTGIATIIFTAAVMVRTKRLFCSSFGQESSKAPNIKSSPSGAKVCPQNQESSPQNQQPYETNTSSNFTTDRSSVTFAVEYQQEYCKTIFDNGESKNGNVANRPHRSKSFDYFADNSPKSDEATESLIRVNSRRFSPTQSPNESHKRRCLPTRHHSAPAQHFGAPMELRIQPNDGNQCSHGSSLQPSQPRRQSAQPSRPHYSRSYPRVRYDESVTSQGKQEQAGFYTAMSGSNNGSGSQTRAFSSECAIHHGRMTDMPRRTDEDSSNCTFTIKSALRKLRKLCVNPRVTTFAILESVLSIAIGISNIVMASIHSTQGGTSENEGIFYHVNEALDWSMAACGLSLVILFTTHSSMKIWVKELCQTRKGKKSRGFKVSPGVDIYKTSGSSTVRIRTRRTQSQQV